MTAIWGGAISPLRPFCILSVACRHIDSCLGFPNALYFLNQYIFMSRKKKSKLNKENYKDKQHIKIEMFKSTKNIMLRENFIYSVYVDISQFEIKDQNLEFTYKEKWLYRNIIHNGFIIVLNSPCFYGQCVEVSTGRQSVRCSNSCVEEWWQQYYQIQSFQLLAGNTTCHIHKSHLISIFDFSEIDW